MKQRKRTRGFRRRGWLRVLYGVLSVVLICATIVGACIFFFQVESIEVTGNSHYSAQQIIDAAGVKQGDNLLLISQEKISSKVSENLPYVYRIDLERSLPTSLKILVTENLPAAALVCDEEWWLLAANGRVLEQVSTEIAQQYTQATGLYLVEPKVGERAKTSVADRIRLESLISLLAALQNRQMLASVSWIDASSATEMEFGYDGRITAKILMNADYERKIWIFQEILSTLGTGARGVIDMKNDRCYYRPE